MRTDRASRLIAAAPERVYRAFIDAEDLAAWLVPEGMSGEMLEFDPRAGGGYRMALTYLSGEHAAPGKTSENADIVATRYVQLIRGKRIVQTATFESEDAAFAGEMTMTWEFEPADGNTRVAITCRDVPAGIRKQDHIAGLKSSLANLARFVEGQAGA